MAVTFKTIPSQYCECLDLQHDACSPVVVMNLLQQVLDGQASTINAVLFRQMIFIMANTNPKNFMEIVTKTISVHTKNFHTMLMEAEKNKLLTTDEFLKRYSQYTANIGLLKNILKHVDDIVDGNTVSAYLDLAWKVAFFRGIINTTYGSHTTLFDFLFHIMIQENTSIDNMLSVINMYKTFTETFKNKSIDGTSLSKSVGDNQKFVSNINNHIDSVIRNEQPDSPRFKKMRQMIEYFLDHQSCELFFTYYNHFLARRLINSNAVISVEKQYIANFARHHFSPAENRLLQRMLFQIIDVEQSQEMHETFIKIVFKVQKNEKYDTNIVANMRREIFKPLIQRYMAWDNQGPIQTQPFKIPNEYSVYLDTYKACWHLKYRNRVMMWNHNAGFAIVDVNLNNKQYSIRMTSAQMFMLHQFTKRADMTAQELADAMGVLLCEMAPILTSFLKTGLLKKDASHPNDKNMRIFLNQDFQCDFPKISIAQVEPLAKSPKIDLTTMAKTIIIQHIRVVNEITTDDLRSMVMKKLPALDHEKFADIMKVLKNTCDVVVCKDNKWHYVAIADSDDD